MIENYRIELRYARAEATGEYEITRRNTRRKKTVLVERYKTPVGLFLPDEWLQLALKAIEDAGKNKLLEQIKDYTREHAAWIHSEKDVEFHAVDCLCSGAYQYWENFHYEE